MKIRIIYTPIIKKVEYQLNILKTMDFIKNNDIYYYKYDKINDADKNEFKYKYKYNIFIDLVSESLYNKLPAEYTILFVNDDYLLNNNYLRREYFKNEPLKLLDEHINFYFCLTKYSYKLLFYIINKKKLYLLNGCTMLINYNTLNINNKYIYYEIDPHSKQDNINLLKVWVENYMNTPYKLIINLYYQVEDIVIYINNLLQINILLSDGLIYYNNIIILFRNNQLNKFIDKINISIINTSYYSLIIQLYTNIINNNFIITKKNEISNELLRKNAIYFNDFTIENIKIMFNILFKIDDKYIQKCIKNNYNSLTKKIKSTNKKLNKFFM